MYIKIKTIDLICKEWFHKKAGNSYFSGSVTVNYGLKSEININIPFQYGYGGQHEFVAFELLQKHIDKKTLKNWKEVYWKYYKDNNIKYNHCIKLGCKKTDLYA